MTDLRKAAEMALEALEMFCEHGAILRPLETKETLRQALAQPEQEPVAWMHNFIEGNVVAHKPADISRHPDRWTPLYTAPPKREWVGLTDEEYKIIHNKNYNYEEIACAIEAKLKEKNA